MARYNKEDSENIPQLKLVNVCDGVAPLADATNLPNRNTKKDSGGWLSWALPSFFSNPATPEPVPVLSTAPAEPEPAAPSSLPSTPIQRPDGPKPRKRRVSTANKAEPLVKKLWKKKERERLIEIDAAVKELNFQIEQTEIAYRRALRAKMNEECEELTAELSALMHQKVGYSRERMDIKARICRARGITGGAYSV